MTEQLVAGPEYRPRHRPRRRTSRRIVLAVAALILAGVVGTGLTLWLHGYHMYVVHTGSMEPNYMPGDLVIDAPAAGHYHRGEIITFRHSALTTDVVTHRVTRVTPAGLIHTKGDANRTADVWEIRPNQVRGVASLRLHGLGYLAVYLRQPAGIGSLATVVASIVLLWGIFFPADAAEAAAADPRAELRRSNRPQPEPVAGA